MSKTTRTLVAAFVFLLLVSLPTATIPLKSHLIGNNIDNWIFFWNDYWLRTALGSGQSPLFTPQMFAPHGTTLLTHSNSFLSSVLAIPLAAIVGPIAAHNVLFLFGLWMGALGMFLLINHGASRFWGGLVGGLVFALAPYHLTQALAHDHLGSIHWWPWFALVLTQLLTTRRFRWGILTGLFAALTFYSGLQLVLLLALWTAFLFSLASFCF